MSPAIRKRLTMLVAIVINPAVSDQEVVALVKRRGFNVSRNDVHELRRWLVQERRFYDPDEDPPEQTVALPNRTCTKID
jgi:hypothetical protein